MKYFSFYVISIDAARIIFLQTTYLCDFFVQSLEREIVPRLQVYEFPVTHKEIQVTLLRKNEIFDVFIKKKLFYIFKFRY